MGASASTQPPTGVTGLEFTFDLKFPRSSLGIVLYPNSNKVKSVVRSGNADIAGIQVHRVSHFLTSPTISYRFLFGSLVTG